MRTRFDLTDHQVLRFHSKVADADERGCMRWTGAVAKRPSDPAGGYGLFHVSRSAGMLLAHRVAWFLESGEIPQDKVIDHLCRVRTCCNPSHLDPVTQAENMARGVRAQMTHCKRGHEFTEENTYLFRGSRGCRMCRRAAQLKFLNKQGGA